MGASLAPEGVTVEEGSQRVMPWGFLVYRSLIIMIVILISPIFPSYIMPNGSC